MRGFLFNRFHNLDKANAAVRRVVHADTVASAFVGEALALGSPVAVRACAAAVVVGQHGLLF
jgi:hypothetical protein